MWIITVRLAKHVDCHDSYRLLSLKMHVALMSRSKLANSNMRMI